jgi:cellobiose-specific phosphotransferase system component IIA
MEINALRKIYEEKAATCDRLIASPSTPLREAIAAFRERGMAQIEYELAEARQAMLDALERQVEEIRARLRTSTQGIAIGTGENRRQHAGDN